MVSSCRTSVSDRTGLPAAIHLAVDCAYRVTRLDMITMPMVTMIQKTIPTLMVRTTDTPHHCRHQW